MKKLFKRLAHSALAVVLAVSMTPVLAFAETGDPAGENTGVTYTKGSVHEETAEIAKRLGMDTTQPMDLNRLMQAFKYQKVENGTYVLTGEFVMSQGSYYLSGDLSLKGDSKSLHMQHTGLSTLDNGGIAVADDSQVSIDLKGHTLTTVGSNAHNIASEEEMHFWGNGGNGGKASSSSEGANGNMGNEGEWRSYPGILLNAGSTLTFTGSGTVNATGGNASPGGNGGNGGGGYSNTHLFTHDDHHGGGYGGGGYGGGAASPGIGSQGNYGIELRIPSNRAKDPGALVVRPDREGSIVMNLQGGTSGAHGSNGTPGADDTTSDWAGVAWGGGGGAGAGGGGGGAAYGYGSGGCGGGAGQNGKHGENNEDGKGTGQHSGADLCGLPGLKGWDGREHSVRYETPVYDSYTVHFFYQKTDGNYGSEESQVTHEGRTGEVVSVSDQERTPTKAGYVLDSNRGELSATLKGDGRTQLNVYFRLDFTVTFNAGEHGQLKATEDAEASSVVEVKGLAYNQELTEVPLAVPEAGYVFAGWDVPVETHVTKSASYTAVWTEVGEVAYRIEKYIMDADGAYSSEPQVVTKQAKVNSTVRVSSADMESPVAGHAVDLAHIGTVAQGVVSADPENPLVLKLFFSLAYDVTYDPGEHGAFQGQVFSGELLNAPTPQLEGTPSAAPGWTFVGWTPEIAQTVTQNVTYTAQYEARTDTLYTLEKHYMNNGSYEGAKVTRRYQTGTTGQLTRLNEDQLASEEQGYVLDTAQHNDLEAEIAGDDSTVFVLYYKQALTVTFKSGEHGSLASGGRELVLSGIDYGTAMPEAPGVVADDGWIFAGWTLGLPDQVLESMTFTAAWLPIQDAWYRVEVYYEGDGSEPRDIWTRQAIVGETVQVTERDLLPSVVNYVFDESADNKLEGVVEKDEGLVLTIHFKKSGNIQKGDANMSGKINIVDVQVTYDIARGAYENPEFLVELLHVSEKVLFWLMDADDDSVIDATDAFAIQRFVHYGEWGERNA